MPGPTVQELLRLPPHATKPNAYEVFGLTLGENDPQLIRQGIERRIAELKSVKDKTDPGVWSQAAKAVALAEAILSDPVKKAELDARYGIVAEQAPSSAPANAPIDDPLAALLPTSQPSPAGVAQPTPAVPGATTPPPDPSVDPPTATVVAAPPPAPVTTPTPTAEPVTASVAQTPASPLVVQRRGSSRRRRSSMMSCLFMTAFLGILASAVGLLAVFVLNNGEIQLVKSQDGVTIKSGSNENQGPQVGAPRPPEPRGDGIMKPPPNQRSPQNSLATEMPNMPPAEPQTSPPMNPRMDAMMPNAGDAANDSGSGTPAPSVPPNEMSSPTMSPSITPPPTATEPAPPTPQQIAAGKSAIEAAKQAIVTRQWDSMLKTAEAAESKAITPEQKATSQALQQIADLATYYREGLSRAMDGLVVTNMIEIKGLPNKFIVQEASPTHVQLMKEKGSEYRFTLDDIPFVVADSLAPYTLPMEKPQVIAARAVFRAIAAKSTPGHREESIDVLNRLAEFDGANPKKIADTLATLPPASQ